MPRIGWCDTKMLPQATGTLHGGADNQRNQRAIKANPPPSTESPSHITKMAAWRQQGARRAYEEDWAHNRFITNMPRFKQSDYESSCGTTALAMTLAYFGIPATAQTIDRSVRPWGKLCPSEHRSLASYARRSGLRARIYENLRLEDLATHLRANRCIHLIINHEAHKPSSEGFAHAVLVIGINRDHKGRISRIKIRNPIGYDEWFSSEDMLEQWGHVSLARRIGTGEMSKALCAVASSLPTYHRQALVLAPKNAPLPQPKHRSLPISASTDLITRNAIELGAVKTLIRRRHKIKALLLAITSILGLLTGLPLYITGNIIARNATRTHKRIHNQILTKASAKPVLWLPLAAPLVLNLCAMSLSVIVDKLCNIFAWAIRTTLETLQDYLTHSSAAQELIERAQQTNDKVENVLLRANAITLANMLKILESAPNTTSRTSQMLKKHLKQRLAAFSPAG